MSYELVKKLNQRHSNLKQLRSMLDGQWQEISEFISPFNTRFNNDYTNDNRKRGAEIYDPSASYASSILSAGMMSGVTSPSRPWFELGVEGLGSNAPKSVKLWLSDVTAILRTIISKSNAYRVFHNMYSELADFGTSVSFNIDDFNSVSHLYQVPIGEFCIAANQKGEIDTVYREYKISVETAVRQFGYANCPNDVKNLYDRGNYDQLVGINHCVEPRHDRDPDKIDNKNMRFKSIYWSSDKNHKYKESGFDEFPALAPRWKSLSGNPYGYGPGMEVIDSVKSLQHSHYRKMQVEDYRTQPPLQVPTMLKGSEVDLFPGGLTYYDSMTASGGIRPLFEVNISIDELMIGIKDSRDNISRMYFTDIFMMLQNITKRMTAMEVAEKHEEKILMLGPVLERLNNEMLSPYIETAFNRAFRSGMLPPPPQEIQGLELKIEYVSILAKAQKLVALNDIDRFSISLGSIAQIKPEALDKFDSDSWVEIYADSLGVHPSLIIPTEQAALIRQQRAEQAAQDKQMVQMAQAGSVGASIGSVPTENTVAGAAMGRMGMQ